jgi:hypothetical protein
MTNIQNSSLSTSTNAHVKQNAIVPYNEHLIDCQELAFKNSLNNFVSHKVSFIGNFGLRSDQNTQIVYQNQDVLFYSPIFKSYQVFVKIKDSKLPIPSRNSTFALSEKIVRVRLPYLAEEKLIQFIVKSKYKNDVHESKIFILSPQILSAHKIAWFLKNGTSLSLDSQINKIQDQLLLKHLFYNKFTSFPKLEELQRIQKNLIETDLMSTVIADRFSEWMKTLQFFDLSKVTSNIQNIAALSAMKILPKIGKDCFPDNLETLYKNNNTHLKRIYFVCDPVTDANDSTREKSLILQSFEEAWENPAHPLENQINKKIERPADIISATSNLYQRMMQKAWTPALLFKNHNKEKKDIIFSPLLMKGLIEFISTTYHTPIRTILDSYGNYLSRGIGAALLPNTTLYVTCEPEVALIPSYKNMCGFLLANGCKQEVCVIPHSIDKANLREEYASSRELFGVRTEYPQAGFDLSVVSPPPLRLITNLTHDVRFPDVIKEWQTTFINQHVEKCWNEVRQNGFLGIITPIYSRGNEVFDIASIITPKVIERLKDGIFLGAIPLYSQENDPMSEKNSEYLTMPHDILLLFAKKESPKSSTSTTQQNSSSSTLDTAPNGVEKTTVLQFMQQINSSTTQAVPKSTPLMPLIQTVQESANKTIAVIPPPAQTTIAVPNPTPLMPPIQTVQESANKTIAVIPPPVQTTIAVPNPTPLMPQIQSVQESAAQTIAVIPPPVQNTTAVPMSVIDESTEPYGSKDFAPPSLANCMSQAEFDQMMPQPMDCTTPREEKQSSLPPTKDQIDFADNCFS